MQADINHVASASTAISVYYRQRRFVAEKLFPRVPVENLRDVYFRYGKQAFRAVSQTIAPGAFPKTFTLDLEPFGYFDCKGFSVMTELPDAVRNHSDNKAELDMLHQDTALGIIALAKELQAIALINVTTIPLNSTLAGTTLWSDYDNSDPITEMMTRIETIQQAIGVDAESMNLLLPRPVWRTVMRNPQVREDIKFTQNIMNVPITPQNLANALGIREVIIADNLQLTSAEGQTDVLAYTWGNMALLYHSTGAPARMTPNFGYTFWATADSYPLKRIRNEVNDADYFKSQEYRDIVLVEPRAAYLWNTPI